MILVGGAIQFYSQTLTVQDLDIRQVHLASAVMQMIEDDLRASQHPAPIDTSALESLLASTASQTIGGAANAAGDVDLSAAGVESGDDSTAVEVDAATTDLEMGASVLQTPGLIGNQYQIQVDLSRLPRLEEYTVMMDVTNANIDDIPSDLKTVTYYVQQPGMIGGVVDSLDQLDVDATSQTEMGASGGLVRRVLDRAATTYSINSGSMVTLNQTGELLAPEITAIEFEYWDGTMWLLEWNSDEYGELPAAVRVSISMQSPDTLSTDAADEITTRVFTHIVRLPMARPIETTETESESTEVAL
ncbi:hypothetical protein CA13_54060 [Planctomycetes bacterium CA13]|uniref:Uncharacterized protein n=2 Tax=Novipirellula herctigrandis TaxID=2527986 RepID=A0A5C5Z9D2_9BACT|nr:hypothetical protein CA13_54060 [Planctomycetes bacterium CA13]